MHRTSRAPLLSATRTPGLLLDHRPSLIGRSSLDEAPALLLGQRAGLLDPDLVADRWRRCLVVDVELLVRCMVLS